MSQRLTCTTADLLNTTISSANDALYFDVQTPAWEPHLTSVRRLDPRTGMFEYTGRVRNEGDAPTAVSLYEAEFEPVQQWIRRVDGTKPGESWWQFDDGDGGMFAWSVTNGQLELRSMDDGAKIKRPLAKFRQHKRYLYVGFISEHAYLEIDSSIAESVDAIIMSLLVVERKRRAGTLA